MNQRDYFEALYADNSDPWHYRTRWYEQRKREVSLAVLPKPHYQAAIELGCSNGVFTALLAARADKVTALDGNAQAVALARQTLVQQSHVTVEQAVIPADLPAQGYDLIVIGEILYYLSAQEIEAVLAWVQASLLVEGTLICTHWRYPIDGFVMNGETVHQQLRHYFAQFNQTFLHQVALSDTDFLLDVWQRSIHSVAQQEGLVPTHDC